MTPLEIESRVARYIGHLDRMLASKQISMKEYKLAILDLGRWAQAKFEQSSPGAEHGRVSRET